MLSRKAQPEPGRAPLLNLFCSPDGDAWRVHVSPLWFPDYLRPFFDRNFEAYPVYLDLEDLDRHMRAHDASFEKRAARSGGVELTARDAAAVELAVWLSTALASGTRARQQ